MTKIADEFHPLRPNHGYRNTFTWSKPALTAYVAAERRPIAVRLNRYPGVVVGASVQVGSRVLSLRWGRPGPLTADSCKDCALGVEHIEARLAGKR